MLVSSLASAVLLFLAPQAGASSAKPAALMVGDVAPKLVTSRWVQGKPVPRFKKGTVYIVDFWATWCGPCVEGMPALTKLQNSYGDRLAVIGMNVWDYQERVPKFIKDMKGALGYRVALDRLPPIPAGEDNIPMWSKDHGANARTWLKAAGADGIPSVFLIDKNGRIAWIGSDIKELEQATAKVIAGRWDLKSAAARHAAMMRRQNTIADLRQSMFANVGRRHWEPALKEIEALRKLEPNAIPLSYFEILIRMGQKDKAYALAKEHLVGSDSSLLTQMSQLIVFAIELRGASDLEIADAMATRAIDLDKGETSAPIEVRARIAWYRGNRAQATELQRQALSKAASPLVKERALFRLADYERVP